MPWQVGAVGGTNAPARAARFPNERLPRRPLRTLCTVTLCLAPQPCDRRADEAVRRVGCPGKPSCPPH
eukprot:3671104-Prorocentrum_lima.AAC.1